MTPQKNQNLSEAMKRSWAARRGSRYFSPETRAKLAEAARQRWARARATTTKLETSISNNANVVKYVSDDTITKMVEVLRDLMPADELINALSLIAHERITALSKGEE